MIGQPNLVATLALALWPLLTLALVQGLGPARGLVAGIVGGYLLLPPAPAGFDLPLLPTLGKDALPALSALGAILLVAGRVQLWPADPWARGLLVLLLLAPWATVLTNPDPVAWGPVLLPGLHPREAVGMTLIALVVMLPLLLGRALLADGARDLLPAFALGALLYSLPMLLEVRLSPQLNIWIYGFFQHSFEQMMRGEGFRPIVFLYHGLWAAFLVLTGLLAAVALGRQAGREGRGPAAARWFLAALWLAAVLVLCKSLGSLLLALLFAPVMLLAAPRWQMRLAALLAALTLAYPLARGADLVPADTLVALATRIDAERAHSLAFRLDNEQRLLDRAAERPLFGWGLWGRQFERDPLSGRQTTIPDGRWIITLGSGGWLGFAAEFGLLALPVLLIWWRMGASGPPPLVAALGLIHAVNLVDLIPNATLTPLTALAAGALWAAAEAARRAPDTAAQSAAPAPRAPAFRTVL